MGGKEPSILTILGYIACASFVTAMSACPEGPLAQMQGVCPKPSLCFLLEYRDPKYPMFGYCGPNYPGHPLAQRPHILGPFGSKDLKELGFETLTPHFGGTRMLLVRSDCLLIRINSWRSAQPRCRYRLPQDLCQ